jgi:hypothetical protein
LWISRDVIDPGLMSAPVINRRTVALEAIFFMWNPPRA